jgi:acetyl esterase/lipase
MLFFTIVQARTETTPPINIYWDIPAKRLPLPFCASKHVIETLSHIAPPDLKARKAFKKPSLSEWEAWERYNQEEAEANIPIMAKHHNVRIEPVNIGGVSAFRLTPDSLHPQLKNKRFIYLHGGAYVFGGGKSGLFEAILIAQRVGITVISVDYRMPPKHPYPAALDDTIALYTTLLKHYKPEMLAIGGSSAGGGLALAALLRMKKEHLPMPAAVYAGTPWADLSKCGDSLFVNEGIDRKVVTYDGFVAAAAELYASNHDLKTPEISPLYGNFEHFPPTIIISGTRDLFLSLAVRVHRKLRAAGVQADLHVFEGLSHVEYFAIPDAPESKEAYIELQRFLLKHFSQEVSRAL